MRTFRYSLRIKLSALEGVRNMYVEYASMKADELMDLQCQLQQTTLSGEDSDSKYEEEEFDDDEDQTEDEMMQ